MNKQEAKKLIEKTFSSQYTELFFQLKEHLDGLLKKDEVIKKDFEEKEISTVDFAKKTLGQIVFLYFLQQKGWFGVAPDKKWGEGSKKFLRELFKTRKKYGDNFFNDILEPLFYEAFTQDRGKESIYPRLNNCRMPFLNGGLFEPMLNYSWETTDIVIPDELFSNDFKDKKTGDTGTGILDIFDRYNFTVSENEPLEKEVAIDPEMLGKVFESLLDIKDRKSKGTFYTPREIVHYMCQESLINYLETETKNEISRKDLELFIQKGDRIIENDKIYLERKEERDKKYGIDKYQDKTYKSLLPKSIQNKANELDNLLQNIKVADPAVGSGAFPLGMINEIVRARKVLNVYLKKDISAYELKKHTITHSIYGVDIDPGAVDIAKLRLWLALIVDEETPHPLPNLEYKIMQGNSLISEYEETQEIKKLRHKNIKPFFWEFEFSDVFKEKGGFDIVIGNPPYIQLQKNSGFLADQLKNSGYQSFARTGDIYALFYEKGNQLLSDNSHLCFITSNKWMRAGYGEKLREYFIHNTNPKLLIDLGPGVFETATVDTNILLFQKNKSEKLSCLACNVKVDLAKEKNSLENYIQQNKIKLSKFSSDAWIILNPIEQQIKEKIEKIGTPLKDLDIKINRGVLTGFNEAFIIDGKKKDELIAKDHKSAEIIKPILRGKDIKRYSAEFADKWLIATLPAMKLNIDNYPAIKEYLQNFAKKLEQTGQEYIDEKGNNQKSRKKTCNKWFETQDQINYYKEFEKEKIVWGNIAYEASFTFDKGSFINVPANLLTSENINIKYLVSIMNSKIFSWEFENLGISLGKAYEWKKQYVEKIHIPQISPEDQKTFINLVDKILKITSAENYDPKNPPVEQKELEAKIDEMVFELYGLTEDEIGIIEGESNILLFQKYKTENFNCLACSVKVDLVKEKISLENYIQQNKIKLSKFSSKAWIILNPLEQQIKDKIEKIGTPLKDLDIKINRGVLTGFNEAFIIDGKKKDELIAKDHKSAEIIKPILRGKDIKRYSAEFADKWLIASHNGYKKENGEVVEAVNIENYPDIKEWLDSHWEKISKRGDKGKTPYNLRNCAYQEEFEKEKIVYPNMTKYLPFIFDNEYFYTNQKCFIITGDNLKYLVGFLNSKISHYWILENCPELQGGTRELSKVFFQNILIPQISPEAQKTFIDLVDKILEITSAEDYNPKNPPIEQKELEKKIDGMVYELYGLTEDEIGIIEGESTVA